MEEMDVRIAKAKADSPREQMAIMFNEIHELQKQALALSSRIAKLEAQTEAAALQVKS